MFVLRRPRRSSFAADAYVFCGGAVDDADGDEALVERAPGFSVEGMAERMRLDTDAASRRRCLAFCVAAVRETFEESGILLGGRGDGTPLGRADASRLAEARAALVAGTPFSRVLRGYDLVIAPEQLTYIAHFITPVSEPRRYDTRFFVAAAPFGQAAAVHAGEATDGAWCDPARLLADHGDDLLRLMPPTRIVCAELARHASVAEVVADLGTRPVGPVLFDLAQLLAGSLPDRIPLPDATAET